MKTFIIDLDNTLLDTERFKGALFHSIKPVVSRYLWDKTYQKVMGSYVSGYNYTFEEHAILLADATDITRSKILKIFQSVAKHLPSFLYRESLPLLEELKKSNKKIILLTYGNIRYQKEKIKLLKINKYFKQIIITPKKKDETKLPIKSSGKDTVFINDNPFEFAALKKKYPKALFLRKKNRFKSSRVMLKEFPPFKDIGEIHTYLKKNHLI